MNIARRLTRGAAAALLGTTGVVTATLLTAAPAHAAVDQSSCRASWNLSTRQVALTCYNPVQSVWDVRVECDKFSGGIVYVNGTRVYNQGWGTSIADCPIGTEIGSETAVDL